MFTEMPEFRLVKSVRIPRLQNFNAALLICSITVGLLLNLSLANSHSSQLDTHESLQRDDGQNDIRANAFDLIASEDVSYSVDRVSDVDSLVFLEQSRLLANGMEIIYPNGGETLAGNVTIRWTPAFPDLDELVQYSVYYSPDSGAHWIQIAFYIVGTNFRWETVLYETQGASFLIKVTAYAKSGGTEEDFSDNEFIIDNTDAEANNPAAKDNNESLLRNLEFLLFAVLAILLVVSGFGLGFLLLKPKLKRQETFLDVLQSNKVEYIEAIRHKLIIGLDNIKAEQIADSGEVYLLNDASEQLTMADSIPPDFQNDLRTEMKGRTVLTLIEIAYQDPSETNPAKLSKSLNIPPSTLSKEIKKLIDLKYVEMFISTQVLHDGRYRNFIVTPKGFSFLSILNEALRGTIDRMKGKGIVKSAVLGK